MKLIDKLKRACDILFDVNQTEKLVQYHVVASCKVSATIMDKIAESGISYSSYDNGNLYVDVDRLTEWLRDEADSCEDQKFADFMESVHSSIPVHMDINFHL